MPMLKMHLVIFQMLRIIPMRLLVGLLAYVMVVAAIASALAAVLYSLADLGARTSPPQNTQTTSPRIQAWLERKAEGVAFAEKQKAEAQAERERADALRARLAAAPEPYVAPRPYAVDDRRVAERERATRARQTAKRESRRQLRQAETRAAYGFAAEPRRAAFPYEFLTQRDRYGY
jgi:hypothetical protein